MFWFAVKDTAVSMWWSLIKPDTISSTHSLCQKQSTTKSHSVGHFISIFLFIASVIKSLCSVLWRKPMYLEILPCKICLGAASFYWLYNVFLDLNVHYMINKLRLWCACIMLFCLTNITMGTIVSQVQHIQDWYKIDTNQLILFKYYFNNWLKDLLDSKPL